jgi:hypothetical protein
MTQFSRILDLPAELRYNIYHQALLPEILHVSLTGTKDPYFFETFDLTTGKIHKSSSTDCRNSLNFDFRKISFEHIGESQDKMVVEPFSISRFRVNRQIYDELQHLFYNKSTWFFNSLDNLVCGLIFLPDHVRMKIRHLSFTLMAVDIERDPYSFPGAKIRMRNERWSLPLISGLLQSNTQLRTLKIQYSKLGMLLEGLVERELRQMNEGQKAAWAITKFLLPGVVTSFLYRNAEMTKELLDSAGKVCGASNVEWRSLGQDRYCTPLAELVIRQALGSSTN